MDSGARACATVVHEDAIIDRPSSAAKSRVAGVTPGDPKLAAPADNGGPTYTMLPGADSAALQAGADCEPTDQRGQVRNTAACDLGSVEVPLQ